MITAHWVSDFTSGPKTYSADERSADIDEPSQSPSSPQTSVLIIHLTPPLRITATDLLILSKQWINGLIWAHGGTTKGLWI